MVGRLWVGCWVLLALSCGRTANNQEMAAGAGSPPATGGTGSGGPVTGGSGPISEPTGQAGAPSENDCPVTPAAGEWVAIYPDPYGFELSSDGSHLSGQGCLGGLPSLGDVLSCSPLDVQQDHGRTFSFVWDMRRAPNPSGIEYVVRMALTLSPERTSMAGKVWTSLGGLDGDGHDVVLVRYPEQMVPPATACSGGEPSGECFKAPLRTDRIDEPHIIELGGGNLLLWWRNRRAIGERIASARFDAASGTWQTPEFLDDGSAPVGSTVLAASPQGWAMVAYGQGGAVVTRAYDPERNAWSKQQEVSIDVLLVNPRPEELLVYDGGDATLIFAADGAKGSALSAVDYASSSQGWMTPQLVVDSGKVAATDWAAASDAARNELVTWIEGGRIDEPFEIWFRSRSEGGAWTDPVQLYSGPKQIIKPAVAVSKGAAIVTWQEWITRLASSSYSFQTGVWSAPLTISNEQQADNGAVRFDVTGTPIAYFHRNNAFNDDAEQLTQLVDGAWTEPRTIPTAEANGAMFSMGSGAKGILVTPLHPRAGESAPAELVRPRCEGY